MVYVIYSFWIYICVRSILQKHYLILYHRVITLYNEGFQKDLLKVLRNNKAYAGLLHRWPLQQVILVHLLD